MDLSWLADTSVVTSSLSKPWIPADRVDSYVQLEPMVFLVGMATAAWVVYKIFLRQVSAERHRNMGMRFRNLVAYIATTAAFFAAYVALSRAGDVFSRLTPYLGLLTLAFGMTSFVKTCRIVIFEYLFLGHMRVGVPVLLVNIFSLAISAVLVTWVATDIFGIRLAPLLATSAALSLVLGLALQDTLGNLFAGLALQLDKPFEIGDWIEVQGNSQKWAGQVHEISWRATVLLAMGEELITIPNRVVSASEVLNFSTHGRSIIRGCIFRIPFGTDVQLVKRLLVEAALKIPRIKKDPTPLAILQEPTDSCIPVKLIYFIDNYGVQFLIADELISIAMRALEGAGIAVAPSRLQVLRADSNPPAA